MTPTHLIMFAVLAFVGAVAIAAFLIFLLRSQIEHIKHISANNKAIDEKHKQRDEMLARGEIHEWMKVVYGFDEVLVCKKTGWCPTLEVYFTIEFMREQESRIKTSEELKQYTEQKMNELAQRYGTSPSTMDQIADDIYSIKKNFFLEKMTRESNKEDV